MPELPEVEVVRKGLLTHFSSSVDKPQVQSVRSTRKDLRFAFSQERLQSLSGQTLQTLLRKGKYLIFQFESQAMVSHLGMTGRWRVEKTYSAQKHDHLIFEFKDFYLVYNDPRRFGFIDFSDLENLFENRFLKVLGVDPILQPERLLQSIKVFQNKEAPIRNVLLDQSVICGVGNIYAAEALFLAGISPLRASSQVKVQKLKNLLKAVEQVLLSAIKHGGSSIDDFHAVDGSRGVFQKLHQVYARQGEKCVVCATKIKHQQLAGRSAFWCPKCQK
jgi:formamidopyrimidine-DNA glycosylase